VLLLLSVYRPYTSSSGRAAALPAALGEFQQTAEHALTPRAFQLLGTDDAVWRSYRDSAGQELFVVALFHAQNWKSVHPPHICLLGSDMEMLADGALPLADGDGPEIGRILLRTRRDGRAYLSLYAYGARGLCTGSYARFFLHHAPRALFRASNDGFLLRVESYADGPGGVDAAEARCRALLQELLQRAQGLLP
jgi:EpsI family protein